MRLNKDILNFGVLLVVACSIVGSSVNVASAQQYYDCTSGTCIPVAGPGTPGGGGGTTPNSATPSGSGGTSPASIEVVCAKKKVLGVEIEQRNEDGSCKILTDCESGKDLSAGNCQLLKRLLDFTNALSGIVAIVVVMMIIIGGIQYSAAGGDPKKVAGAKSRIYNAIFAFLAFIFIYSFLQWLIPGGVFKP